MQTALEGLGTGYSPDDVPGVAADGRLGPLSNARKAAITVGTLLIRVDRNLSPEDGLPASGDESDDGVVADDDFG